MKLSISGLIILAMAMLTWAQEAPKSTATNTGAPVKSMATNSAVERIKEYLNPGEPIRVTVGRKFSISIASNPTTGYGWQLAKPMDTTVAVLITNSYIQDQNQTQRVGVGGHEVWTFKAIGQGQAGISMKYVRPWEQDVAPARTNVFTVIVK